MRIWMIMLLSVCLLVSRAPAAGPLDWPDTQSCRPWAYNWWLGSAVDRENLSRELDRYQQGGLGGIHIVPIYGAKGAEGRYLDYLSPQWMEMLAFAIQEANRRGLGVDMTTGTGWCFGGPQIPPELGCRNLVVKRFVPSAEGRLPEEFTPGKLAIQAIVGYGPGGQKQDLTDRLDGTGYLNWEPRSQGWSLWLLGHQFGRRMVKRAAPGGAGPMINPFSPTAMEKYLQRFSRAFADPGQPRPRAMYHDSFEYLGNWSPEVLEQFSQRRGYRLEDHLDAVAGEGDPEQVARVRCDVAETLSDLVVEDVFPQWTAWCHQRGILTRNQAHGAPANWLDFYALADIPETEMFGHGGPDPLVSKFDEHLAGADRDPLISKFASSAAHTSGKPLVSSETGTWLAEHFCETFEELKCEIDLFLLAGVNHIFYHGCAYSPDEAAWPGWSFYASTQMNPRNPLWREAAALNQYVARCQAILREGQPDNDLLLYWPIHDAWSRGIRNMSVHNKLALDGPLGPVARRLWERGYGFDYVSDRLLQDMKLQHGELLAPGGAKWQAIVVPPCKQMPVTTLRKLALLAESGATVVFVDGLPSDVPGLGRLEERRTKLRELLAGLSPANTSGAVQRTGYGQGEILVGSLDAVLDTSGVRRESLTDRKGLKFIRRRHPEGRYYFLANHGLQPVDGWVPLATSAMSVVVLDPLTGKTGVAELENAAKGIVSVRLRIEPGHSVILRSFEHRVIDGPAWDVSVPGAAGHPISGPWRVEFIVGGAQLPAPVLMRSLVSWTVTSDAAESFAGTARYQTRFDMPEADMPETDGSKQNASRWLDLGDVKHVARVRLNGTELGVLLMHPYRCRIPAGLLRAKDNILSVEVTNLAANRIRDMDRRGVEWRIFHDANVVNINYRPFDASGWPVFDSGLLGPVMIFEK